MNNLKITTFCLFPTFVNRRSMSLSNCQRTLHLGRRKEFFSSRFRLGLKNLGIIRRKKLVRNEQLNSLISFLEMSCTKFIMKFLIFGKVRKRLSRGVKLFIKVHCFISCCLFCCSSVKYLMKNSFSLGSKNRYQIVHSC